MIILARCLSAEPEHSVVPELTHFSVWCVLVLRIQECARQYGILLGIGARIIYQRGDVSAIISREGSADRLPVYLTTQD